MKISAIEAIPVRLPRERDKAVRTAGSPTPLVDGAGDYRWSAVFPVLYAVHFETALVKVTLDSGLIGWGEAQAPLAPEVACAIVDRLLEMYEALNAHIKIARIHSAEANWPARMEQEQSEHEEIVAALEKRDTGALVKALRKHIHRAKDALVATLRGK